MDYVCIDRLLGEGLSAQTVAICFDGKFEDNVSYTLKDTPCGDVVGKTICTFSKGVRGLFPKDVVLVAVRAAGELERREAEEALKTMNQELQSTTSELRAAYKDMESFSFAASHDLRALLRTLDGFSKILLQDYADKLDDKGKDFLNRLRDSANKMNRLIEDLLASSRVSTKEIQKSKFDMRALAQKLVAELKPTIGEKDIKFEIKHLPSAYGDRAMITQVHQNLLSNGIKFTQTRDSAMIEVGGYTEKDENLYYVRDNGIGFDMQLSDKLFGLFS